MTKEGKWNTRMDLMDRTVHGGPFAGNWMPDPRNRSGGKSKENEVLDMQMETDWLHS